MRIDWLEDELILALDAYINRLGRRRSPNSRHPVVIDLSELLRSLPLYPREGRPPGFRSPDSVHLKLANLSSIDHQEATAGLAHGSRRDRAVWSLYGDDHRRLANTAACIRESTTGLRADEFAGLIGQESEPEAFAEGRLLFAIHRKRERNPTMVRRKKQQVLYATGRLACEICAFDFKSLYGEIGQGFAEVHHTLPFSEMPAERATRLDELAVVCSNCHRMLHRRSPVLGIAELKSLLAPHT